MKKLAKLVVALVFCLTCGFAVAKPVNINKATAEEIAQALNGIGLNKAEAIVKDRTENGPFKGVDDLSRVKGVGPVTVSKNKELIKIK